VASADPSPANPPSSRPRKGCQRVSPNAVQSLVNASNPRRARGRYDRRNCAGRAGHGRLVGSRFDAGPAGLAAPFGRSRQPKPGAGARGQRRGGPPMRSAPTSTGMNLREPRASPTRLRPAGSIAGAGTRPTPTNLEGSGSSNTGKRLLLREHPPTASTLRPIRGEDGPKYGYRQFRRQGISRSAHKTLMTPADDGLGRPRTEKPQPPFHVAGFPKSVWPNQTKFDQFDKALRQRERRRPAGFVRQPPRARDGMKIGAVL